MSTRKKRRGAVLIIMLVLFAVLVTVVIWKMNDIMSKPLFGDGQTNGSTLALDAVQSSSNFNTLLIGTDAGGELTDVIMLVNINKTDKTVRMLSIPRDTKVKSDGRSCKINSLNAKGGLELLINEVRELTQVPISYYAMIGPGTLAKIVDSLGGVEYDVERNMKYSDPAQDLYIDLEAGLQTLDGDHAEQYCRFRSYVMGDLTRTQCQQKFLKALFEQKLNFKYVTKLGALYDAVADSVKTNITFRDVAANITVMKMISSSEQIECCEVPGNFNDMEKEGISYYLIEDEELSELRTLCADKFSGVENNN